VTPGGWRHRHSVYVNSILFLGFGSPGNVIGGQIAISGQMQMSENSQTSATPS
jgi:hypothetical protein